MVFNVVCSFSACQDPDLIGDCSRPYALPLTLKTRNSDLKAISVQTMGDLLDGKFDNQVASFQVIDCRSEPPTGYRCVEDRP